MTVFTGKLFAIDFVVHGTLLMLVVPQQLDHDYKMILADTWDESEELIQNKP